MPRVEEKNIALSKNLVTCSRTMINFKDLSKREQNEVAIVFNINSPRYIENICWMTQNEFNHILKECNKFFYTKINDLIEKRKEKKFYFHSRRFKIIKRSKERGLNIYYKGKNND